VRLRPDVVKLDKEIVQSLPDPVSSAVVSAIVDITHAYGGLVLAECVETAEQAAAALALGVDLGQGWHFGRPVRPEAAQATAAPARPVVAATAANAVLAADPARPDAAVAVPVTAGSFAPEPSPTYLTELLERAVESSASGVVVVDMVAEDAPIVYANEAFRSLAGYDDDDLLGPQLPAAAGPGHRREGRRASCRRPCAGARSTARAAQLPQGRHAVVERAAPVARARRPGPPHPLPRASRTT
jgi:PAS domain-containing protein